MRVRSAGLRRCVLRAFDFGCEAFHHRAITLGLGKRPTLFKRGDSASYPALGQQCTGLAKQFGVMKTFFCRSHDR